MQPRRVIKTLDVFIKHYYKNFYLALLPLVCLPFLLYVSFAAIIRKSDCDLLVSPPEFNPRRLNTLWLSGHSYFLPKAYDASFFFRLWNHLVTIAVDGCYGE